MEYQRFQDTVVLRLEIGEEVCAQLLQLAEQEQIQLAEITGIGATNDFTIGVFDTTQKQYFANAFRGVYEITSLLGTLTRQDGKPYLHLHMNAGDHSGAVVGGHLNRAVISATCELVVRIIDGAVTRRNDDRSGLNLFSFPNPAR